MSDLESLFTLLCTCNVTVRASIADKAGIPFCLLQDFVHGHCGLDEELTAKVVSAAENQVAE